MFGTGNGDDGDETEYVTVEESYTETTEYSEHTVVAGFSNGTEKEFVCDEISRRNTNFVELYDYVEGGNINRGCGMIDESDAKIVVSINKQNLDYLHTVNRETKEHTREVEKCYKMARSDAEDNVEQEPDKFEIIE